MSEPTTAAGRALLLRMTYLYDEVQSPDSDDVKYVAKRILAIEAEARSPVLDPCPRCEQVVLVDGEHWVPNGGGWSCVRLQKQGEHA